LSLLHDAVDVLKGAYSIALAEEREDYAKASFPDH